MAYKLPDRVRMSITGTPGTGDVSLNVATAGFQTFTNSGLSTGDTFPYVLEDGSNWELGVGTYNSSGPSFARTTVRASSGGGTSKITAGPSTIVYSAIMGEDVPASPSVESLSDVIVTSVAADDVLTWNGSHWVNEPAQFPYVSNIRDVTITSPADNDVLTFEASSTRWKNKPASGGGGGNSPPSLTTFSYAVDGSGATHVASYAAGRALNMHRTDSGGSDAWSFLGKAVPASTPWTVSMQVRQNVLASSYSRSGLCIYESATGKILLVGLDTNNGGPKAVVFYAANLNTVTTVITGDTLVSGVTIPDWFQVAFDGTTYTFGISWDGVNYFTIGTATAASYFTADKVGVGLEIFSTFTVSGASVLNYIEA